MKKRPMKRFLILEKVSFQLWRFEKSPEEKGASVHVP